VLALSSIAPDEGIKLTSVVYIEQEVEVIAIKHPHKHRNPSNTFAQNTHSTYHNKPTTTTPLSLHIMDDRISSEARKEVNDKIAQTKTSDMNRTMDAASSSKEKREQNKRDREQREKEQRERDAVRSPLGSSQL
jgi:hypothetical protein